MPTQQEMDAAGFTAADYEGDPVELWPENWAAWDLFSEFSSQWRISMSGPTGLDYTPLFHGMDRLQLDPEGWEQRFADVRVIEAAALEQMRISAAST